MGVTGVAVAVRVACRGVMIVRLGHSSMLRVGAVARRPPELMRERALIGHDERYKDGPAVAGSAAYFANNVVPR